MEILLNHANIQNEKSKQFIDSVKAIREDSLSPMEELNLRFNKEDANDINELRSILGGDILMYPSSELAEIHRKANRIGAIDLKQNQAQQQFSQFIKGISSSKICSCCGFFVQDQTLPICTSISDLGHMGISTFLYFQTLKNIALLLTIMLFVHCIFAFVTNLISAGNIDFGDYKDLVFVKIISISLVSKRILLNEGANQVYFTVQSWLGVAVLGIWLILFAYIKKEEVHKAEQVDLQTTSAADYTILIKNFPESITKQQLQFQLQLYRKSISSSHHSGTTQIKINKINKAKPFYLTEESLKDKQLDQINQRYHLYRERYVEWIKERKEKDVFQVPKEDRERIMGEFVDIKIERSRKYQEIAKRILKEMKDRPTGVIIPVFVTFQNLHNKQFIELAQERSKSLINYLPCVDKSKYFHIETNNGQRILANIKAAPEPEDIIWTNQGQTSCETFKKKFFTFAMSILALGGSFVAIFFISKAQIESANDIDPKVQYVISFCVSIINILLQQFLRFLTKLERASTNTKYQQSLAIKAVFILLFNSIAIPYIVSVKIRQNQDTSSTINRLANDIFYLSITNSFLTPFLKIFDGYFLFTRIYKWYSHIPNNKLYLNQNQLNRITQYMEFQVGYQYIYIINLYLFTCFFVSLQPIIVIFAIAGIFIMFWSQKYSLFYRCARPYPGRKRLHTKMAMLIYCGPAIYTLGNFFWANIFQGNRTYLAPNIVAAVISAVILLLPYKIVAKTFLGESIQPNRKFYNDRVFMPSEYDRLNPHTAEEGIKDYKKYLREFKNYIESKDPQQTRNLEKQFFNQYGNRIARDALVLPPGSFIRGTNGIFDQNQEILNNLIGSNQNIVSPFLVGNSMLQNQAPLNFLIQNWLTREQTQAMSKSHMGGAQARNNIRGGLTSASTLLPNQQINNLNNKNNMELFSKKQNNDMRIVYQGLINQMGKGGSGSSNRMNMQGNQGQVEVPLNVPVNIFQSMSKFIDLPEETQARQPAEGQKRDEGKKPGNLFDQLIPSLISNPSIGIGYPSINSINNFNNQGSTQPQNWQNQYYPNQPPYGQQPGPYGPYGPNIPQAPRGSNPYGSGRS